MLKVATRIFWVVARVCWTAVLLFTLLLFGVMVIPTAVVYGIHDDIGWGVAILSLVSVAVLPLTAPWI